MEIAFFTDSYLPTHDGVATVVDQLAHALVRRGHRIRIYTTNPMKGAPTVRKEDDGIRIVRVRAVPVPRYREYSWPITPFVQLRGEGFDRTVDIVHVHTPYLIGTMGFFAARHYRKPLIGTFHTNIWEMRSSFVDSSAVALLFRVAWFYNLGIYWRCDLTTAPTPIAADALYQHARKPFRRPIEVVPNGIAVERFHPGIPVPDWRERLGLPNDPLVTFLGRLTADKGVHRFLDALEAIDPSVPYVGVIGGSGPEERSVRDRIARSDRLGPKVRYLGSVPENAKGALLAQSEIFVLPSMADTSSVALLEAMACGAACVVSDAGGAKSLIEADRTGRIVPLRVPGALAEGIEALLEHPAERRRLGAAAAEYVRATASIDATAGRFISLYELIERERAEHGSGHPE